jgi:hypothetical protein
MILLWHIPSKLIIFMDFWYIIQWINPIKLIDFTYHENRSSKSRFITVDMQKPEKVGGTFV